jgi:peptide-methionine (S)-S-oxide reductase
VRHENLPFLCSEARAYFAAALRHQLVRYSGNFDRPGMVLPDSRQKERSMAKATFAAGCFWGVEANFRSIDGVTGTTVGYTGGHTPDPTYAEVCRHKTGHAEAVEVEFDPAVITYDELLTHFWKMHNPTTKNRQGWDFGDQYRSAIFVHDDEQRASAERSRTDEQANHRRKIVTEIVPAAVFYRAEEYHQQYHEKGGRATCNVALRQAHGAASE